MFSIVELKTAILDYGTPGVSQALLLLLFLMMLAIPMIPYAFLYHAARDKHAGAAAIKPFPIRRMFAWVHLHRHPELLHHH